MNAPRDEQQKTARDDAAAPRGESENKRIMDEQNDPEAQQGPLEGNPDARRRHKAGVPPSS